MNGKFVSPESEKTKYKKGLDYGEAMSWRDRFNKQGYNIVCVMRMNRQNRTDD